MPCRRELPYVGVTALLGGTVQLSRVQVKHFRSFVDLADKGYALDLELSSGMNSFVGPNNCGKSNLFRALALALDPDQPFDQHDDAPSQLNWAYPRVILTFRAAPNELNGTLLRYAHEYEQGVSGKDRTFAREGLIKLAVTYKSGKRQESFLVKGLGARTGSADDPATKKLTRKFWTEVRFVYVHSGESLESLLQGRFRDILHVVLGEHLKSAISDSEILRQQYAAGLQGRLLSALRDHVAQGVGGVFSEIGAVELIPEVPEIAATLANVDVRLSDTAVTSLAGKGTGVRGAVLVAMLRYMADQSKKTMIFAVEEPEAFLHPAAQEALREELDQLAARPNTTLLITTHSPFIVSRTADSRLVELEKTESGRTVVVASREGGTEAAPLLAAMFRDAGLPILIDRALSIPRSARAVVVTEGYTDSQYLQIAAEVTGNHDLIDGLHILAAGGASKVPALTVLTRAATSVPVIVLLDSDPMGRATRDTLGGFGLSDRREILMLHSTLRGKAATRDAEAEDLWPHKLMRRFVDEFGIDEVLSEMERQGDVFHYGLTAVGKGLVVPWLRAQATADDAAKWAHVLEEINSRISKVGIRSEPSRSSQSTDPGP